MAGEKKSGWEKAEIILKPIGGVMAALTVALIGFLGSGYLESRQNVEMRIRLYTELISKREEAESALRKDMFTSIMESFLKLETDSLEPKVLQLELLAYNFHESLNLQPLFLHLKRRIDSERFDSDASKYEYLYRLRKVADEIKWRQLGVLENAGIKRDILINLDSVIAHPEDPDFVDTICLGDIEREFKLWVIDGDEMAREVEVDLEVASLEDPSDYADVGFGVGHFDIPMIDNLRLSNDERCAIVLTGFEYRTVSLTLVYFPGSHASLREKPYFQEIINNLLPGDEQEIL